MGEQTEPMLRPLSIGEIFDRAVTLFVRNWIPFTAVGALAVLPAHVAMYFSRVSSANWMFAYWGFSLLLLAGTMANARVVAEIYRRQDIDWKGAFSMGLRRLLPAIGVNLTIALIAVLPLLIIVGIPAGLGVFHLSNVVDDAVALLVAVCGGAIYVAMEFAIYYALGAMAIDELRAMDAVGRALALFNRSMAGRTLLVGLAQVVIVVGGSTVAGAIGQVIVSPLHQAALGSALEALIVLVTSIYGNIVTSVYYFDVAIRSEGYDMQVALDAMPG